MTAPAASNKRIVLVSGRISPQLVVNVPKKRFPELKDRVAKSGDRDETTPGC